MFNSIFSWETLWYAMLFLYVPACIGLIVVVLLQKGKGSGFAGAFGVGPGSDAVFGPRGARTLPQKLTYVMAATFMLLAFGMSLISGRLGKGAAPETVPEQAVQTQTDVNVLDDLGSGIKEETPASPASSSSAPAPEPAAATPPLEAPAPETPAAPEAPAAPAPSGS